MKIVIYLGMGLEEWSPYDVNAKGMGGSETAAVYMACKLAARGHQVAVYANFREEIFFNGASFLRYERLALDENKVECDVFISSRRLEGVTVAENLKTKLKVLWVHDVNCGDDEKNLAPLYDIVFCLTEWHRDAVIESYKNVDPAKIVLTRNGIETGLFTNSAGEAFDPLKEPGRMVYVSSPNRGLEKLLGYLPKIRKQVPEANLHVYYGFDNWQKIANLNKDPFELANINYYKALIQTTEGVTFHGRIGQTELATEFLKSKVWPYPTNWPETSCISAMEAQAAGCVPVCTRYAALGETVRHGILLPPYWYNDAGYDEGFIEATCKLLTDEPFRKTYADAGRKWALENLSWDTVAVQWEEVFEKAMTGRSIVVEDLPNYVEPTIEENKIQSLLVLLTCKRPGRKSYVEQTITEITQKGGLHFDRLVILFDGPVELPEVPAEILLRWDVMQVDGNNNTGKSGNAVAIWKAIALGDELGAANVVVMEDDSILCRNAMDRILQVEVPPDLALVSFFDADRVIPGGKPGMWRHGARSFSCNVCLLFPRRTARWVKMHDPKSGSFYTGDDFLSRILPRSPWPRVGTHIPNLVEHIGDVSAVWANETLRQGRISNNFPGVEFDAMSLDWK